LVGVLFLALSFIPSHAFLPSSLYWEARPVVAGGKESNQIIGFPAIGSFVRLDAHVYGGNNQIGVDLRDSSNGTIRSGVAENYETIVFDVQKNDYYSLYLKNTDYGDKLILAKVYYYFYNYFFLVPGMTSLILSLVLVLRYSLGTAKSNQMIALICGARRISSLNARASIMWPIHTEVGTAVCLLRFSFVFWKCFSIRRNFWLHC
jgi:hypothetical protein